MHTGFLGTHSPPLSYQDFSDRPFSASGLGDLGACPRRFLFRYVLKAYPPDDPEFDPDRWLNPLERGSLLHAVYEETLKEAAARGLEPADDRFMDIALGLVDRKGARALLKTPSPSEALHVWEMEGLRDDARSFVEMIRGESPRWADLEWRFGMDAEMRIGAGTGSVLVRGVVDRVDDHGTHLRVVDYKTGSGYGHSSRSGVYDGGRRLQHFVYTAAVASLHGKPVDAMEYHFPTRRGENSIRRYEISKLRYGGHLVATLLESMGRGLVPRHGQRQGRLPLLRLPGGLWRRDERLGQHRLSLRRVDREEPGHTRRAVAVAEGAQLGIRGTGLLSNKQLDARTAAEPTPSPQPSVPYSRPGERFSGDPPDQTARLRIREDLEWSFLVEAGAGSGKTTSLVDRIVALVRNRACKVEEIAAVTFTRMAAAELRQRFQVELEREAARFEPGHPQRLLLEEAIQSIDRAFLGTIHSFCAKLLRERPLEAGLDPRLSRRAGGRKRTGPSRSRGPTSWSGWRPMGIRACGS